MTLYQKLQQAKSEEDVKDAYIKALGLKDYSKNLYDIQTKEIWFEAKDGSKHSSYQMFTQLLHYVQQALNKGEHVPPLLCVIDAKKAAIMKTADALPLLSNKKQPIKWGKNASGYTQEALDVVSAYIGTYLVSFKIETHEAEFISTIKNAIKTGEIIRTQITPDNLKQVFDKWVNMIGREIKGVEEDDYALLFYADVMSDGDVSTHNNLPAELLHKNNAPVFSLGGKLYELGSREGYRHFWAIYHRPPKEEYRNYLLERRDSLIPLDERSFKGAYYTPLAVVDKAYDKLTETLGNNWQKEYIVWDMCCGVGNLEVKHSNPRNVYMSTLDQEDVDVMKATRTCVAATRFQYDYLNDDITNDGQIDYALTNKVPESLRKAITNGKKILVLINPPYAEAGNRSNNSILDEEENKAGVAKTKFAEVAMSDYGKASNELFVQFLVRVSIEIPTATIAMFSTMKYVVSSNFEKFREKWNAKYLGGFVVHNKAFEGLKGKFPIGFLLWDTDQKATTKMAITDISVDVLDKQANPIGEKSFYNLPSSRFLNGFLRRPKPNNEDVIALRNAVLPSTARITATKWSDAAIAYMLCDSNDMQHAEQKTAIFSSVYRVGHDGGFYITSENLWQAAIVFCVRRLITPSWLNDRDQFLQPDKPLNETFKNDCLIWMLFNRTQRTASANHLEWNGRMWSIVNHFIPYTEEEINAPERFESDFMVRYLAEKKLSNESKQVLAEGKKLWQAYFTHTDVHTVREELKLNRADVGWYQIRKALQARNNSGDFRPVSFKPFEEAYKVLTEKLQPQIYELGFLRN
jgi:predicted RNA methylase